MGHTTNDMIKLLAINPTGMFSYGIMPVIMLDGRGTVFIEGYNHDDGGSNASGKSSLFHAIKEILFAKNDTGKSGSHVINNHEDWKNGAFGIIWLIDRHGNYWRIINARKWKMKKKYAGMFGISSPGGMSTSSKVASSTILNTGGSYEGTDVFLEKWDQNAYLWTDERPTSLNNKTFKDTQKKIVEDVIGMTYDQFSAYVCLGQKAESALVSGTSGAREKIMQAVADVSIWTKSADIIKTTYTDKETQLSNLEYQLSGVKSAYETIKLNNSEEKVKSINNQIYNVNQSLQHQINNLSSINIRLKDLHSKMQGLDIHAINDELDILQAEERHSIERLNNVVIPEPDPKIKELSEKIGKLNYDIMITNSSIDKFEKLGIGDCGECGQTITDEYLNKEIDKLKGKIPILKDNRHKLQKELSNIENAYEESVLNIKNTARDKYDNEIKHLKEARQKLLDRQQIYNNLSQQIVQTESEYQNCQGMINSAQTQINMLNNNLESVNLEINKANEVKANIDKLQKNIDDLDNEIRHLKWTEKNFKKLKLQEYNSVIDRLNQLVKEELYELWGPRIQIQFVNTKPKTRGSSVKQELDILVTSPKKKSVPIEMHSGGETKTIVVAVFRAMRRLAKERGVGVNISAIDEIDKDLDDTKTDRLVQAYELLSEDSSTCFVISHNSRLKNTLRADEVWTVKKQDGMSIIEMPNYHRAVA